MDIELIEAKRQQRKLNFLITQTELYAHFMSKKLGKGTEAEQLRILTQLDEEVNPRLAALDDYNSERMKQLAQKNAKDAFQMERDRTKKFDTLNKQDPLSPLNLHTDGSIEELPQPNIFQGILKGYQIKGMTWLANLYDQGISGILADGEYKSHKIIPSKATMFKFNVFLSEMGLGKTVSVHSIEYE